MHFSLGFRSYLRYYRLLMHFWGAFKIANEESAPVIGRPVVTATEASGQALQPTKTTCQKRIICSVVLPSPKGLLAESDSLAITLTPPESSWH